MMLRHKDLDFPHSPSWCNECCDQDQRGKQLAEMRRANDIKERELDLKQRELDIQEEIGEYGHGFQSHGPTAVTPRRKMRPTYMLPPPTPAPKARGGMSVEPRRRSAS